MQALQAGTLAGRAETLRLERLPQRMVAAAAGQVLVLLL